MSEKALQHLTGLSDKQRKAIPIILSAKSISKGCEKVGVSRQAFYDWIEMPVFRREFQRQREIMVEEAFSSLQASLADAVSTLQKLLNSKGKKGEPLQFKAANAVIENVLRLTEIQGLQERILSLEIIYAEKNGRP